MKVFASIVLLAVAATPLVGQTHKDPNLVQRRSRPDVSTVSPPEVHSGAKDANAQLNRLEQQTARIVTQPPARKATPMPKPPAGTDRHPAGFEQSLPVHAQSNGLKSTAGNHGHGNRGPRTGTANPYRH